MTTRADGQDTTVLAASPQGEEGQSPAASAEFDTPLGPMVGIATAGGLCRLEFADRPGMRELLGASPRPGGPIPGSAEGRSARDHLDRARGELTAYFAGTLHEFSIPLAAAGTPFEQRVWERLRGIPYGRTCSYGELARAIDCPGGARAVGRANGANPIAIVVPCHRVIESSGGLRGYGGGLHRKRFLLDHEARTAGAAPALFD